MMYLIPTFADEMWTQSTTLEGTTYGLTFQFNCSTAAWYMSVADASGVDIYNGVKLTVGIPLLFRCKDIRRPAGDFVVVSSTTDTSPPGNLDIIPGSGRCQLYYVDAAWMALLAAGNTAEVFAQIATSNALATASSSYGTT